MENPKDYGFNSQLIHYSGHHDQYGAATVPIYQTSTFAFASAQDGADCFAGVKPGYMYQRFFLKVCRNSFIRTRKERSYYK